MYENKQKPRIGLWILFAVLLAAMGYGIGVTLRAYQNVRIVETDSGSGAGVYRLAAAPAPALEAWEIYDRIAPACVSIRTEIPTANMFGQVSTTPVTGSGFLTTANGYIFTNYHVVEDALTENLPFTVTLYDGRSFPGTYIGGDERSDVALVKIEAENLPCCELGDFSEVAVGDVVYAIGNPLGELTWSMTEGIVSAMDRTITISETVSVSMFQIDAAINSGNSGGPVLNDRGQVIGIASAKYKSSGVEGLGFAIPVDDAKKVIDDVLDYGYVRGRALLGLTPAEAARYGYEKGVLVYAVTESGPAASAGLRKGDVLLAADGEALDGVDDWQNALRGWKPGEPVEFTVLRGGKTMTLTVTPVEDRS